jgi:hypothetical protein
MVTLIDDYLAIVCKEGSQGLVPNERLHERNIYQSLWFLLSASDYSYFIAFESEELCQSLLPLSEQFVPMDKNQCTDLPLRDGSRRDDGLAEARGRFEHAYILLQDRIQRYDLFVV